MFAKRMGGDVCGGASLLGETQRQTAGIYLKSGVWICTHSSDRNKGSVKIRKHRGQLELVLSS